MSGIRYAKGPVVYLYDKKNLKTRKRELLWGDWLRIGDDIDSDWSEVKWGRETFAIRKRDYQEERLCEMIFLDVGQGDGCILTTPILPSGGREKIMIIDAGVGDNMNRYLHWRFRDFKKKFKFHAAVITHPDGDHYFGFQDIFENEQVSFEAVYHNGLLERTGSKPIGPVANGFVTDIRASKTAARQLYSDPKVRGRKRYPHLIWTALSSDRFDDVRMLSSDHGQREEGRTWMPGFGPSDYDEFTIEVLGPVVEKAPNGEKGLRTFGTSPHSKAMNLGRTKNGHSIVLRLRYRDFSVLFGGDLNTPAEHFLMRHYGNHGEAPTTVAETSQMISEAREYFAVDLMKTCHHGSSDVTDEFLEATGAAAFVISSGDEESYVHPRPDLLGLLGKKGRGQRPLLLSTELLRSTRESEDPALRTRLDKLVEQIDEANSGAEKDKLRKERDDILDELFRRNVGVYGAVNLRTDGRKAVIAFRKEKPKGISRWFVYELKKNVDGVFQVT